MCRLVALPPGTAPEIAHELVSGFVRGNDDGVGEAYVVKGEFKLNKYPYSYHEAVTKKDKLFSHMPYDGWTIAHVRLKTDGDQTWVNTHPFIKGDTAVCHNGMFYSHKLIKAALGGSVKWSGECDSEVAAYLYNKLGPEEFYKQMPNSGSVYLGLRRDGTLSAVKLGMGDLKVFRTEKDSFILASEFPYRRPWTDCRDTKEGVLKLDDEGHAKNFTFEKKENKQSVSDRYTRTSGTGSNFGGCRTVHGDTVSTYTHEDIARFSSQAATVHTGGTSGIPLIGNGKKKKAMDLWDWPTEQEINECLLEGM